jgi:hypothetical protein
MSDTATATTAPTTVKMPWGAWGHPVGAAVAWGARAIYALSTTPRAEIDIPGDRQSFARDEHATDADVKALEAWINTVGLPELSRRCIEQYVTSDSGEIIEFSSFGYTLKAGPRRSHGYLYIVAWRIAGMPAVPPCAASMGCLCAGHANGASPLEACNTTEQPAPTARKRRR